MKSKESTKTNMDQSDIKYIISTLSSAKEDENWEMIEDAIESLKEFLDDYSEDNSEE